MPPAYPLAAAAAFFLSILILAPHDSCSAAHVQMAYVQMGLRWELCSVGGRTARLHTVRRTPPQQAVPV